MNIRLNRRISPRQLVGLVVLRLLLAQSAVAAQPVELVGAFNAASYQWFPPAGAAVAIFGRNLSAEQCAAAPSAELCGTALELRLADGRRVVTPVTFVSPEQINGIIPSRASLLPLPQLSYPDGTAAKVVVVRRGFGESVMTGPPRHDAIDIFFLNPDLSGPPSSPGLYTRDASGRGVGVFQRLPSFEAISGTAPARPGEVVVAYGTGYRDRILLPGSQTAVHAYEVKLTAPDGRRALLYNYSLPPPPGGVTYAGPSPYPGLDQYNILLPPLEWFQSLFGPGLVVPFELVITPGSSFVIPSYPSNTVILPVSLGD